MFDYSLAHWTAFFSAVILLNISPGPDLAFILGQTISNGRTGGFSAMFGIWMGAFIHVLMASVGLSAILATSAVAFSVVKWVGVIYLLWLGIRALRSNGGSFINNDESAGLFSPTQIFRQGILISLLNPKVALFFLAFLPQFVVPGAGPTGAQLFLHGCLIIVVAALIEPPLVIAGAHLVRSIHNNTLISKWIDRGLGTLFILLGLRIAISQH